MRFIYDFILVVICSPSELHTHKSSRSAVTAIWIHKDLSLDKIFNVELTLTWITYLVTDENKSWYWDIIYISLCVNLNSCHCYCWLPSTHVIFWMHLHRRTCKERDNTEYCPVAWTRSVLVCGLEGPWVSKALLFSCTQLCERVYQAFLFYIDEGSKSNSFVCGNLNQHSLAATATADSVAQRQKKIALKFLVSSAHLFPQHFFCVPTTAPFNEVCKR